jgi:hypothetical protein
VQLGGVSVHPEMHVVASDLPPPRWREKRCAPQGRFVAESQIAAVMRAEIKRFTDYVLLPGIAQAVGTLVRECEARCTAKLEDVMKEFTFKGAWQQGERYRKRNLVSLGGAIYFCSATCTESRPGLGNDWVLFVPKPRDGRDGKDAAPPEPPEQRTVRSERSSSENFVVRRR